MSPSHKRIFTETRIRLKMTRKPYSPVIITTSQETVIFVNKDYIE